MLAILLGCILKHVCGILLHFQDDLSQITDCPLIAKLMEIVYLFAMHILNGWQIFQIPLCQDIECLIRYEL